MAKIKLGALAGEISGSIGCYTFAHNRGGPYVRLRNVQDKFSTPMANAVKGAMEQLSKIWRELPEADRAAWTTWASANPVVDTLGEKRVLTGSQAFFMLTWRTGTAAGKIATLPTGDGSPRALRAASVTASKAGNTAELSWSPAPLAANEMLSIFAGYSTSPSRTFTKNAMRIIGYSNGGDSSPFPIGNNVASILGNFTSGQILIIHVAILNTDTGLLCQPVQCSCTIT